jgi:hypothetical protein
MTSLTVLGFCNFVAIDFNDLILVEKLEQVLFGIDRAADVLMNETCCNFEAFRKEVDRAFVISETYE